MIRSTFAAKMGVFRSAKSIGISEIEMAGKKTSGKKSSSGSDPKSKGIVKKKMGDVMHEFKHHDLQSGGSGKKVSNPKQAIAIGLSEARRSGADIPPDPNKRKGAVKKGAKKAAGPKASAKKSGAGKPRSSDGRKSAKK